MCPASRLVTATLGCWVVDVQVLGALGRFKQSGFGRELGPRGLTECRETKYVWRNTRPTPQGWFD